MIYYYFDFLKVELSDEYPEFKFLSPVLQKQDGQDNIPKVSWGETENK